MDNFTNPPHITGLEFARHFLAGALLAIGLAVGFAAASHADNGASAPQPEVATTVPQHPVIGPDCTHPYFFNGRAYCG